MLKSLRRRLLYTEYDRSMLNVNEVFGYLTPVNVTLVCLCRSKFKVQAEDILFAVKI